MLKLRMDISLRTDMKNQRQIISEKEAFRNIIEAIVQMGQFKINLNATINFLSPLFGHGRQSGRAVSAEPYTKLINLYDR